MVKYVRYYIQYFHSSWILERFAHQFFSIVDIIIFYSQQFGVGVSNRTIVFFIECSGP